MYIFVCQISARLIQLVFLLKRQMPPFATAFTVLNPTGQSREWDKGGHMLHVFGGFKTLRLFQHTFTTHP